MEKIYIIKLFVLTFIVFTIYILLNSGLFPSPPPLLLPLLLFFIVNFIHFLLLLFTVHVYVRTARSATCVHVYVLLSYK